MYKFTHCDKLKVKRDVKCYLKQRYCVTSVSASVYLNIKCKKTVRSSYTFAHTQFYTVQKKLNTRLYKKQHTHTHTKLLIKLSRCEKNKRHMMMKKLFEFLTNEHMIFEFYLFNTKKNSFFVSRM